MRLKELTDPLRSDRLIKIYIGDDDQEPFLVQRRLLESESEYFKKAFQDRGFRESAEDTIRFREDDQEAWMAMLHWMVHGEWHESVDKQAPMAIKCWVLGDKYQIHGFQNAAMLSLLNMTAKGTLSLDIVQDGLNRSPPGSKLRKLLVEEVVLGVRNLQYKAEDLTVLHGLGLLSEHVVTVAEIEQDKHNTCAQRWTIPPGNQTAPWRRYMVGDGGPREYSRKA